MKRSILILFLLASGLLFAQVDKARMHSTDALKELEGKLTLRFFDALTGNPIEGAKVTIEGIGDFTTNHNGGVLFASDEMDATHTVVFTHDDYITSKFDIQISAGTIFFNRFSVSPKMKVGDIRIVLDWDKEPRDLDAHLVKDGQNGYHISFRNMHSVADGEAKLDRDDTDSYGPETITINRIDQNATYHFFVHDYSNRNDSDSRALAHSKATVKVYSRTHGLIDIFTVPTDLVGVKWNVFSIVDGKIVK